MFLADTQVLLPGSHLTYTCTCSSNQSFLCFHHLRNHGVTGTSVDLFSGGVREALFGNEYYRLMWGKRVGFAKIAMQAGVVSVVFYFILQ